MTVIESNDGEAVQLAASVVIPALNVAAMIEAQLSALADQDFDRLWELIVVDNGSTDDTIAIVQSFEDRLPNLRIVACDTPGMNPARTAGIASANSDLLLLCDADDVVARRWVGAMVEATGRRYELRDLEGNPVTKRAARVHGHEKVPAGGQMRSPLVATESPR